MHICWLGPEVVFQQIHISQKNIHMDSIFESIRNSKNSHHLYTSATDVLQQVLLHNRIYFSKHNSGRTHSTPPYLLQTAWWKWCGHQTTKWVLGQPPEDMSQSITKVAQNNYEPRSSKWYPGILTHTAGHYNWCNTVLYGHMNWNMTWLVQLQMQTCEHNLIT